MKTADVFCRVVDNFGDAGVAWRLCRALALEKKLAVRLWIDDVETLNAFVRPSADDQALIERGLIEVILSSKESLPDQAADLVIETFGCDVPMAYAQLMAERQPQSRWINLEYLSAEEWVEGCHGLPSPHPVLPITRWFFFPGFTAKTGGLLKEADLERRRAKSQLGQDPPKDEFTVSLFSYDHDTVLTLLEAWNQGTERIHCRVFQGGHQARIREWVKGQTLHRLSLEYLPWMSQAQFDEVLFTSDFNMVRGEDSFVRAQWAGRPFLWDIYPTEDEAHLVKMAAFLKRYREGVTDPLGRAIGALWQAWVRRDQERLAEAWQEARPLYRDWQAHAKAWAEEGLPQTSLLEQLWDFLKSH